MANVINNAAKFSSELIETFIDGSYIAPFITTNVEWLNAKDFHFTTMQVGGYKPHKLSGGWNRQPIEQSDNVFTVSQDRDVEFFVDKREVDESNTTASTKNISTVFEETQATPEKDAYFFSKVSTVASAKGLSSSTDISDYTKDNITSKIQAVIGKVRLYRNKGLILYVRPEIMDLLALSTDFTRNIESTTIVQDGKALQTRITSLDGTPIVEVVDVDRFYSAFDFTDGFTPVTGSFPINMLAATPLTTKMVPKIESIYLFAPGQHTEGDGYLYQNRAHYDTFTFPNNKGNAIDSIYVDLDTTAVA